jgi:hypothetical protein
MIRSRYNLPIPLYGVSHIQNTFTKKKLNIKKLDDYE